MNEIKNLKSGEIKKVSASEWESIKSNPFLQYWKLIEKAPTPPEVVALEEKKVTAEKSNVTEKRNLSK